MAEGREEAYVLRFVDAALAARVRSTLAEEPEADPADAHMELDFDGETVSFRVFSLTLIWSSSIRRKKLSLGPVSTKKKNPEQKDNSPPPARPASAPSPSPESATPSSCSTLPRLSRRTRPWTT